MARSIHQTLSLILIAILITPQSLLASTTNSAKVAFVAQKTEDSENDVISSEMAKALAHEFSGTSKIINPSILKQKEIAYSDSVNQGEFVSIYQRLVDAKNKYSLEGNNDAALEGLDSLSTTILNHKGFNRELSKIYESLLVSKAWIHFQSREQNEAKKILQGLSTLKQERKVDCLGFPRQFTTFCQGIKGNETDTARLQFETTPKSVDVFLNGIYAGNSSDVLYAPQGTYLWHASSQGRRTLSRKIHAKEGLNTQSVKLSWMKKSKQHVSNTAQNSENTLQRLAMTDVMNSGINADKVVLIKTIDQGEKNLILLQVFDQNFSQPLKEISYSISDPSKQSSQALHYFSRKISSLIDQPANRLWKGDFDRNIKIDERIVHRSAKPLYRKPVFWGVLGAVVVTGVVLGVTLSAGGGGQSTPAQGSVSIDLGGFQGGGS